MPTALRITRLKPPMVLSASTQLYICFLLVACDVAGCAGDARSTAASPFLYTVPPRVLLGGLARFDALDRVRTGDRIEHVLDLRAGIVLVGGRDDQRVDVDLGQIARFVDVLPARARFG